MNGGELVHGFQFDNQLFFNQQINPPCANIHLPIFNLDRTAVNT